MRSGNIEYVSVRNRDARVVRHHLEQVRLPPADRSSPVGWSGASRRARRGSDENPFMAACRTCR